MNRRIALGSTLAALVIALVAANHLLTAQDRGPAAEGRRRGPRGPRAATAGSAELGKPPIAKTDQEKKVFAVLEKIKADRSRQHANVSADDGRLMRMLTESMGAKRVVEVGMSTGYSALWFALALRATGGKLYTHEMDAGRIRIAREHFREAGVEDLITIIEGNAHEKVREHKEPIDILFLDADKQGYIDYLEKLLPLVRPGGLIMAHNMVYPAPDPDFIKAITTNPDLDTMFLLMQGAGLSVSMKKR